MSNVKIKLKQDGTFTLKGLAPSTLEMITLLVGSLITTEESEYGPDAFALQRAVEDFEANNSEAVLNGYWRPFDEQVSKVTLVAYIPQNSGQTATICNPTLVLDSGITDELNEEAL